jgi:MFS family permease
MMVGMLLGVIMYRPMFSFFLKNSNVKEWVANQPDLPKQMIKSDTIKIDPLNYILHQKYQYTYNGTRFFRENFDTVYFTGTLYPPLSALGGDNSENLKRELAIDAKPVYSNVILSPANYWRFIAIVFAMIIFVTMVYGPIAAFLVEMFPTKIRYTSMSLPYHIGNGVFGGLVPFIGLLLTTTFTRDPLVGLWYPIGIAALCFIIGAIYLTNKIDEDVTD